MRNKFKLIAFILIVFFVVNISVFVVVIGAMFTCVSGHIDDALGITYDPEPYPDPELGSEPEPMPEPAPQYNINIPERLDYILTNQNVAIARHIHNGITIFIEEGLFMGHDKSFFDEWIESGQANPENNPEIVTVYFLVDAGGSSFTFRRFTYDNPIATTLDSRAHELDDELIITLTPRNAPFLYSRMPIAIPNRQKSDEELSYWIEAYNELGGPSAFELEVTQLVNDIRIEHGLDYLELDLTTSQAARFYAQLLGELNFISGQGVTMHDFGPYGGSRGVADAFGNVATAWAFNGASGLWTASELVEGWMNSPGHRENILNEHVTHIGAGSHLYHLNEHHGVFHYGHHGVFHYLMLTR